MKQNLLLFLCLFAMTGLLQAQTHPSTSHGILNVPAMRNHEIKFDRSVLLSNNTEQPSLANQAAKVVGRTGGEVPGSIILGTTYYDLQTGLSVARRVLRREDGSMSIVWTGSKTPAGYTDRGTFYAHYNGVTWDCIDPQLRLEPIRTGWPCIDMLNGSEFIVSHNGTDYTLEQGTSSGTTNCTPEDWTFTVSGASMPPADASSAQGTIWPRMAIDGSNIVVLSNFGDTAVYMNGVQRPVVYAHSSDGGATWTANNLFPGFDSTRWDFGLQDMYDIDANNGKMSAVIGFLGTDVTLWNSSDGGTSWTEEMVDPFPFRNFEEQPLDSVFYTSDGTESVVIDDSGKTHVAYAIGAVTKELDATTGLPGSFLLIGVLGLKYWEEGMTAPIWVINPDSLPSVIDANGDGTYDVGVNSTLNGDGASGDTYNRYTVNISLLTAPSISYDYLGNVFITFMLAHDADTTDDGQTYRNIYLAMHKSEDPWSMWDISDITPTTFVEQAYATCARKTTDSIRFEYQEDFDPGTAINSGDPDALNNINYLAVANPLYINVGIPNVNAVHNMEVNQNAPNPFNDQSTVQIILQKQGTVSFKVTDVLGSVVMKNNYSFSKGAHNISLSKNLFSSGVYYYTVQMDEEQITKKMIVQ
ncbi:MAG: T9SS type A sorting domain-containing protein [Chitinophagales bacterium]|nr:T9SS type A sorting domain-containing protein [Chitinophagales bacterium]